MDRKGKGPRKTACIKNNLSTAAVIKISKQQKPRVVKTQFQLETSKIVIFSRDYHCLVMNDTAIHMSLLSYIYQVPGNHRTVDMLIKLQHEWVNLAILWKTGNSFNCKNFIWSIQHIDCITDRSPMVSRGT